MNYQVIYNYEHEDGTVERGLYEEFNTYKEAKECYDSFKQFEGYTNIQLTGGM